MRLSSPWNLGDLGFKIPYDLRQVTQTLRDSVSLFAYIPCVRLK
jgi:hypothetical protein